MSDIDFLKYIHARKTGSLIEASLQLGGVAGDASTDDLERLAEYGRCIGLAFQIVDDCLDIESTAEQLGKQTRKDSTHGKLTYPGLLGLETSKRLAADLIRDALGAIAVFGEKSGKLAELANFVIDRSS
jgi:geranylgeranyl diphosphate synthase type II